MTDLDVIGLALILLSLVSLLAQFIDWRHRRNARVKPHIDQRLLCEAVVYAGISRCLRYLDGRAQEVARRKPGINVDFLNP